MFVHNDKVGMLAGFADAPEYALLVLSIRLVSRLGRKLCCGFIWFASGFDAQLIHSRPVCRGRASLGDEPRRHSYERNRTFRRLEITGCSGFLQIVSNAGMSDIALFHFSQGILNAG